MKRVLKVILILVLVVGLVGGGVFAYFKLKKPTPCDVYPAMQWMMSYMPNQTYLYGIVTSDASQMIYKDDDRTVLEILVNPGDVVSIGDPLLRYDATRALLSYEQSKLDLVKLENKLRASYAEYRKYAREDYESPLLTPTPSPTPRPRHNSAGARSGGVSRLSSRTLYDLHTPTGGSGTESNPFVYEIGENDRIPYSFLQSLLSAAVEHEATVFAKIVQPEAEILLSASPEGAFTLSVRVENSAGSANLDDPRSGNGTASDPLLYDYASGAKVSDAFLTEQLAQAAEFTRDWYVRLKADRFAVDLCFSPDGSWWLATTVQAVEPTATPSPTPTPTPTPSPTPEPSEEPTPTPYHGGGGGMSRAEREAYAREIAKGIREDELRYRQLLLDIEKAERSGLDGILFSEVNGTVMNVVYPEDAQNGDALIEIRGGTGLHISVIVGEDELMNYPVGTELTGFSYMMGENVTARVTKVGTMPISTNYSGSGNPNSSGYLLVLDIIGDVVPGVGEYIEFSDYSSLYEQGTIYLHEAFIREIDGESCVFVADGDVLVRRVVKTGSRMNAYVELLGAPVLPEDRIAFPYDKNCKEGNPVQDAKSEFYYYGW